MTESRYDIVLDIVRANSEGGMSRAATRTALHSLAGDAEAHSLVDRAVREVFDGVRCEHPDNEPCEPLTYERGDRVTVTIFDREFPGAVETWHDNRDLIEVFVPALSNTVLVGRDNVSDPKPEEPKPLPDINPVEALASIIAKATTGLLALADEHEGNLRDAVTGIDDVATELRDLVERW